MTTISEALAIAVQHHQAGRLHPAEQIYRQILAAEPNHADAWHLLGVLAHQVGNHEVAVQYMGRAIALTGNVAAFHNNLANVLKDQGKLDEAVACYHRALELEPDRPELHNNLGVALKEQRKLDEAVAHCRRATQLRPDWAEAHNNLGAVFRDQGKLDDAVASCRRALELKPDFAEAHNNLGNALYDQGELDRAMACYRRALELKPDYAEAHGNHALMSLLTGDFQRGWAEYEWRWKTRQSPRRDFSQPLWDGRPLEGGTILLHAEQGLGDTIQFIRYAPLVGQAGARVLVECPQPLVRLLAGCRGIDELIGRGDELPSFDVQAPLLSLPRILCTSLDTIPADVPYLFADPRLVEHWRGELGALAGCRIGIAWRGNPENRGDRDRSIPLSCFEALAGLPGVHLVSLQKGAGVEELHEARGHFPVTEVGSRLEDFMDTAAVLSNLHLVVACDTAVAHLAGALGVPAWVALPLVPDWRWLRDRRDSPWYPTLRLFRQKKLGDWPGVFAQIKAELCVQLRSREYSGP